VALTDTLLVLRALGLGDLLTALPALRGLRRGFPDSKIVLATAPQLGRLAAGAVDDVLPASGLAPLAWSGTGGHLAVNLHGSGPRSHRVLLDTRPRRLLGYAHPAVSPAGPAWDPAEHEVARWCRLLDWYGVAADPADLLLPPAPEASPAPGAVVIHPGAAYASRRWPARRFAAVAAALIRDGHQVVVTGSAAERELADRVVADSEAVSLAGRLSLPELIALLQRAQLVIVGDTGVGHLATACAAPTVHVFGPEPPSRWGPLIQPDRHVVIWHGERPGDPRGAALDPALAAITVEDVLAAAHTLLPPLAQPGSVSPPTGASTSPV
jgi:ADP-heptose:LPS heptosyltransferase